MLSRRLLLASITATVTLPVLPALAAAWTPFTPDALEAALAAGSPVLVAVHATWCPTCKAQDPILNELTAQPKFAGLIAFRVDFDSEKPTLRKLNVPMQSTLIIFRAGAEVARSVGDTGRDSISALLDTSL